MCQHTRACPYRNEETGGGSSDLSNHMIHNIMTTVRDGGWVCKEG